MFGLQQVVCGRGSRGDTGELHRAFAVACELRALGCWMGADASSSTRRTRPTGDWR